MRSASLLLRIVPIVALGLVMLAPGFAPTTVDADEPMKPHRLHVPSREGELDATLWVRDGFTISVFGAVPGTLRTIAQAPTGEMVVSELWEGRILILRDRDGDGFAEEVTPLLTGLSVSHGVAFAGTALYVTETNKVLRLDPWNDPATATKIITLPAGADIPGNPNHQTRSVMVGPDNKLYVSIGSYCDACAETDPMRGAIWRYNLDGTGGELFARGLRNAVGMTVEPATNRMWVAEMGSNNLGPDLPPDEINVLGPAGSDYGWPYCYGNRTVQPPLGSPERCANTVPSVMDLPAHVAPLGLAFVTGSNFPAEYQGDLILAQHGSALLDDPIGYKVVRIPMRNGQLQPPEELVRGWLRGKGAWGRPVMPFFGLDGNLYLTDDKTGVIYRIQASRQ